MYPNSEPPGAPAAHQKGSPKGIAVGSYSYNSECGRLLFIVFQCITGADVPKSNVTVNSWVQPFRPTS